MKKRIIGLLLLCLFTLSSTAFAATWVYAMRDDRTYHCDVYIDSDKIEKNDRTIIFWMLVILDRPNGSGEKKIMIKTEATLTLPRNTRDLDLYTYDSDNRQLNHDNSPPKWYQAPPGSLSYGAAEAALRYAK